MTEVADEPKNMNGGSKKPVRVVYPVPADVGAVGAASAPGASVRERQQTVEPRAVTLRRSRPFTPIAYPPARPRWVRVAAWWVVGLLLCVAWDRALWLSISSAGRPRLEWLEQMGSPGGYWAALKGAMSFRAPALGQAAIGTLYAVARFAGKLYPWLALAAAVVFSGWASSDPMAVRRAVRRGVFIAAVPAVAGLMAEGLKLLLRRARPEVADGWYAFRAFADRPFDAANLGLASSDVAVVVGGALVVGWIYPRARLLVWPLAIVSSVCRVLVGAHFASDVYVAATLAAGAFAVVRWADRMLNPRLPAGAAGVPGA